jgi:aldehyde dehydrogenase (NAD+)/aldehyde dehydrogenase
LLPQQGQYFDNPSPVDGKVLLNARSTQEDIDLALDAAHEAFPSWSTTSVTERSNMLLKIAQVMEDNLEYLATLETIDNGKPIRESRAADILIVSITSLFRWCYPCR